MCLLLVGGRDTRAGTQASTGDGLDVGQVIQNRCEEISKMVSATPGQTKPKEAELKEAAKKKKPHKADSIQLSSNVSTFHC